jgi:hypothetical protein
MGSGGESGWGIYSKSEKWGVMITVVKEYGMAIVVKVVGDLKSKWVRNKMWWWWW